MDKLNDFQKIVARNYANGDYAYIADLSDFNDVSDAVATAGDGLFRLLMSELSTHEGVDTYDEALRRVHTAQRDLQEVVDALVLERAGARS